MSRRDLTVPALTVPLVNDKLTKLAGATQHLDDSGFVDAAAVAGIFSLLADNFQDFGSTARRARRIYVGRIIAGAATPTVAVAAGFGTGPSAAVDTGSSDLAGIITITTGTVPAATGSITVTYSTGKGAYGTNAPAVSVTAIDGAAAWDTAVTWKLTANSTTAFTVAFKNAATNFTASTTYKFAWVAIGK